MSNTSSSSSGTSWLGLLGVIFVVAKVFEIGPVAAWSWWLVLLPFYLGLAIVLGAIVAGAVGFGAFISIGHFVDKYKTNKRRKELAKQATRKALTNKDIK